MIMFSSGISTFTFLKIIFIESTKIQIYNILFLLVILLLLIAVCNSLWLSISTYLTLSIIVSITNYEKVKYRNEGILPSDLSMIGSFNKIISMVGLFPILLAICAVVLIFMISFFLLRKNKLRFSKISRIIILILSVLMVYTTVNMHGSNGLFSKIGLLVGNDPKYYDPMKAVSNNGPILNFANNLNVKAMDKPKGYNKKNITIIEKKYKKISIRINKKRKNNNQTLIFILSESFSDPNKVPQVKLNRNPIPYTKKIIEDGVGGNMISDGYGGGTANMEYQALTGFSLGNFSATLPTPYTQLVVHQKKVYTINNLFSESIAIHPYFGSLYDREKVFNKMKFSKFEYLDHGYPSKYSSKIGNNPYVSDKAAYKYVLSKIKNDKNQFIQLSTMQNHMPFDKKIYQEKKYKVTNKLSKEESDEISNYSMGIHYTDLANEYFINQLKKMKQNVTVVFYGDHLPAIYSHVNLNKNGVIMHETPYFIWSNTGKLKDINYKNIVGPYSFGSEVMQATNTKITPYYAMLQRVNDELPIIASKVSTTAADPNLPNGGMNLINRKNKSIMKYSELSEDQKKLLHDYQMVQYDLTEGKGFIGKSGFMNKTYK